MIKYILGPLAAFLVAAMVFSGYTAAAPAVDVSFERMTSDQAGAIGDIDFSIDNDDMITMEMMGQAALRGAPKPTVAGGLGQTDGIGDDIGNFMHSTMTADAILTDIFDFDDETELVANHAGLDYDLVTDDPGDADQTDFKLAGDTGTGFDPAAVHIRI